MEENTDNKPSSNVIQEKMPNHVGVLVLGILSIVFCWCYGIIGRTLGIIAIILASKGKALYLENPEKYLPQYGGWCAYAMGEKAEKVTIDPETFIITDGKLYLFYNSYFNDTSEKWNKEPEVLKVKADKNWNLTLKNY